MDDSIKKPQGLAGDIPSQTPDAFLNKQEQSPETKLLVEKIENKEKNITDTPSKNNSKPETFLERLFKNTVSKNPSAPATASTVSTAAVKPDLSKFIRAFLVVLILLVICAGSYLFIFLTNIDTQLMKLTLSGTVSNSLGNTPIEGAEIFIDNTSVAKTDSAGKYSITIQKLSFDFKVTKKDFGDFVEATTIPRSILSYSFTKNVSLTSTKVAQVTGKFVTDKAGYKFTDDKLFFNDEEFILNEDGTFNLTKVPTGKVILTFESKNFLDIRRELTLNAGNNVIQDIKVTEAGDVVGSVVSYVREDLVLKTKFTIENVLDSQILINNEGKFRIKDLDVGRTYKIRSSADGYKTRDYEVKVSQGDNELFGFKMIEEGTATYISEGSDEKDHFFAADLDGKNSKQIESVKDINARKEFYNSTDGLLYFLSGYERMKGYSKTIDVAYSINPETLEMKRVTQSNIGSVNDLIPNFAAKKMLTIVALKNDPEKRKQLQILDITGDNLKVLRNVTGTLGYDNLLISNDGKFVIAREGDITKDPDEIPTVYRINVETNDAMKVVQRKDVQVHAVSKDGGWVIYSALNESTNFRDLFLFTAATNETRTIKENHDGTSYQFLNQSSDQVIFVAKRDLRIDIFIYSISQNSTNRVTSLAADDEIRYLYQQENYAFYITKRGLYVIDILKPHTFKLVTNTLTKYTN